MIAKHQLADFLGDDYCARCDSFGHTEKKNGVGMLWCNCCWDWRMEVPSRLRRTIQEIVGQR